MVSYPRIPRPPLQRPPLTLKLGPRWRSTLKVMGHPARLAALARGLLFWRSRRAGGSPLALAEATSRSSKSTLRVLPPVCTLLLCQAQRVERGQGGRQVMLTATVGLQAGLTLITPHPALYSRGSGGRNDETTSTTKAGEEKKGCARLLHPHSPRQLLTQHITQQPTHSSFFSLRLPPTDAKVFTAATTSSQSDPKSLASAAPA